ARSAKSWSSRRLALQADRNTCPTVPLDVQPYRENAEGQEKVTEDCCNTRESQVRTATFQKNDIKGRCFETTSREPGQSMTPNWVNSGRHILETRVDYPID